MNDTPRKGIRPWLELLRLPNLLTVPGDPLAGCFLAAGGTIDLRAAALAAAVSLCVYTAGLVLNDLADLEADRRERPSRPLPSGRIRPACARGLLAVLLAAALVLLFRLNAAARGVGLVLVAAVLLYDIVLKRVRFIGPVVMGSCRGLSLLLGAAAVRVDGRASAIAWAAALGLAAAIAALTGWSRNEARVAGRPERVGFLLSLLLPVQALLVLLSRHPASVFVAAGLLALWPVNRIMGRVAYSS